jgi:hypothetical protein
MLAWPILCINMLSPGEQLAFNSNTPPPGNKPEGRRLDHPEVVAAAKRRRASLAASGFYPAVASVEITAVPEDEGPVNVLPDINTGSDVASEASLGSAAEPE